MQGAGALALAGPAALTLAPASRATPEAMQEAIDKVAGSARLNNGRIKIDIPPLVENGNVVPLTVTVDSPMTAENHVKAIHVFNEKNPQPYVMSVRLGPRTGKASVSTRIRLATTQMVVVVAEMSDETLWTDRAECIVTQAACVEATL